MWRTFPVRRTADERIFLAVFFLYIKKYATWCPLSQQTIVPTLTVGLTFNVCRVSSVSSSSSRQSQTSARETPTPTSHGWLCCHARIVATSHPKTLRIFPGSCSFPSEASPSSSALVRSPRRRPLVLSTWSTTERNKEMTVHGEDDNRDPPASWQYPSKCLYSTYLKIWFLLMVCHLGSLDCQRSQ